MITRRKTNPDITKNFKRYQRGFKKKKNKNNRIRKLRKFAELIIESVIKKCPQKDKTDDRPDSEQKYCLYTKNEDRLLGRHPSKEKAEKHERAIQYFKHK